MVVALPGTAGDDGTGGEHLPFQAALSSSERFA
jgi:hypothetical protein